MAVVTYQRGDSDERPWGRWEVLDTGDGSVVRLLSEGEKRPLGVEKMDLAKPVRPGTSFFDPTWYQMLTDTIGHA